MSNRTELPPIMKLDLRRIIDQYESYGLTGCSKVHVYVSCLAEDNKRHGYPLTMDYLRGVLGSCGVDQEAIETIAQRFAYDEQIEASLIHRALRDHTKSSSHEYWEQCDGPEAILYWR